MTKLSSIMLSAVLIALPVSAMAAYGSTLALIFLKLGAILGIFS